MQHGEEQGSGGVGQVGREGEVSREGGGGAGERQEGRASAEEALTRDWVEFPLNKGKVALVNVRDLVVLARNRWTARKDRLTGTWYAIRKIYLSRGKYKIERMHRRIMEPPDDMVIDHINGDGLDNRRANLRVCTKKQNNANRRRRITSSNTRFIGVTRVEFATRPCEWHARIWIDKKDVLLGAFDTPEEAAHAYDAAVVAQRGDFCMTNFPMGVGRSLHSSRETP
jgi:hypothetical protein